MTGFRLLNCALLTALIAHSSVAGDKPPAPSPNGVVIDFRGPPENGNFKIDVYITLEGQAKPVHNPVSYSSYSAAAIKGHAHFWRVDGYVVEPVGETRLRFVGWKDKKTGKVTPVTAIKFESKDLAPEQLPTVVPGPKDKG